MNHKIIKNFTRIVLTVSIAASGFFAVPIARAETPADITQQSGQTTGEAGAAGGQTAPPIAPAEPSAGAIQQPDQTKSEAEAPVAPGEPPAGQTAAPNAPVVLLPDVVQRPRQPKSEIEVGVGKTSADSYKFGDYLGLEKSKPYFIGNVQLNRRSEDNAGYLEINGRNLGLDSRNVKIRGGQQDNFAVRFEYDELTRLRSDSYQTPYTGMGTAVLTKPATWTLTPVSGSFGAASVMTTQNMADLAANMKQFNVETQRKATKVGLNKALPIGWDVDVSFKRENKDGTKLVGAPMQINAVGARGSVIIPEPINYTTDQFDVFTRYAGEKLHLQFGYYASLFRNANQSTTFDNLYQNSLSTPCGNPTNCNGSNAPTGQLSQMPDNQFHQLNAEGGYTISQATRLTGSVSRGRMTQNQAFLPYATVIDPATPALPVASLNGLIETTHADIKLNSRLTHELNFTAGYRYNDRNNRTPVNTYTYQVADNTIGVTSAAQLSGNSASIRRNTPLSNNKQVLYADLDYRLSSATKLKLGYDYEKVRHTFEPTTGDHEGTIKAEIKQAFSDTSSGGFGFSHSERKASAYNEAAGLPDSYTSAYLASLCVIPNTFLYNGVVTACTATATATSNATIPFLNTPAVRKFFLADRKRNKLHAFANVAPNERLDLQFDANYSNDKYPDTESGFGLTHVVSWAANFNASLAASDTVSGTFFTTLEDYSTEQNGHNGASGTIGTTPNTITVTVLDRQNNTALFDARTGTINREDRSVTLGLGFKVKPGGNFDWGSDLTHTFTIGSTGFSNLGIGIVPGGIATATAPATPGVILPVPDVFTRLTRLELFGKYKVQKDMTLNMRYAHERYTSADWAWDGQTLTSSTSLVGTNQTSPKYSINMVNVSLSYMF